MTLTKLALAVLGTIGLTAGTVLAVSEPAAPPLPAALAQVSTGSCPGSNCASGKCRTAACPLSAVSVAASKCSAEKCSAEKCSAEKCSAEKCSAEKCSSDRCPAPPQSEPIVAEVCAEHHVSAPIGTRCGTCLASQSRCSETVSLFDADGICRKHFIGHGATAACTAKGHVLLTGTTCEKCTSGVCAADAHCEASSSGSCEASSCEGECPVAVQKATRRFTLGIGLSNGGPIIHVATGSNDSQSDKCESGCSAASTAGRIVLSLINRQTGESDGSCDEETCQVTATACRAKSTCATASCPTSACAIAKTSECEQSECAAECVCCPSSNCQCRECNHGDEQPQASIAPSILHIQDIIGGTEHPEWRPTTKEEVVQKYFSATPGLPPVFHHEEPSPGVHTFTFETLPLQSDPAGRVRIAHGPVHHFPRPDVRPLPQFEELPHGHRIRLSGFAAPVAAPFPTPQPSRAISPRLEGTWTRTLGDDASSFTFQNGRVQGRWKVGENGIEIRFSGTCMVTKDEQFIGIIDEIEAKGDDGESFEAHMLVQRLVDQPFAVRFVADGESLIIKDIRCSGLAPSIDEKNASAQLLDYVRTFGCGRFERGDD